jgi:iron-sulfur cluster repair protein YtfE (RIC family)
MSQTTPTDAACVSTLSAFDILSHCHNHIEEKLNVLDGVGQELQGGSELGDSQMARLGAVLAFLDTAIPIHSADEEESLFPRLRQHPAFANTVGHSPMDCMESEHVEHAAFKARLKLAMMQQDAPAVAQAARAIASEYRTHIRKEEDILYPMAKDLLADGHVIEAMTEEMRGRRREAGLLKC